MIATCLTLPRKQIDVSSAACGSTLDRLSTPHE